MEIFSSRVLIAIIVGNYFLGVAVQLLASRRFNGFDAFQRGIAQICPAGCTRNVIIPFVMPLLWEIVILWYFLRPSCERCKNRRERRRLKLDNSKEALLKLHNDDPFAALLDVESRIDCEKAKCTSEEERNRVDEKFKPTVDAILEKSSKLAEQRGICAAYIVGVFAKMAIRVSGLADPKFYDLKENLARGPTGIGKGKRCPRDFEMDSSIVDSVRPCWRGQRTHFLSWCWGYRLSVVVSSLKLWAEDSKLALEKVNIFCCYFVNNQYRMHENFGTDKLREIFETRLRATKRMLVMMDVLDDSEWSKRLWCVFEAYTATCFPEIQFEVILPEAGRERFLSVMRTKSIEEVKTTMKQSIDIRNAKATEKSDQDSIMKCIADTTGFDAVNQRVAKKIGDWAGKEARKYFESDTPVSSFDSAVSSLEIGPDP